MGIANFLLQKIQHNPINQQHTPSFYTLFICILFNQILCTNPYTTYHFLTIPLLNMAIHIRCVRSFLQEYFCPPPPQKNFPRLCDLLLIIVMCSVVRCPSLYIIHYQHHHHHNSCDVRCIRRATHTHPFTPYTHDRHIKADTHTNTHLAVYTYTYIINNK